MKTKINHTSFKGAVCAAVVALLAVSVLPVTAFAEARSKNSRPQSESVPTQPKKAPLQSARGVDLAERINLEGDQSNQKEKSDLVTVKPDQVILPVTAVASTANYTFSTVTNTSLTDMSSATTQLVAPDMDDGNLRKNYAAAANKTFEVGTANGCSPVAVNATAPAFPADFTVESTQGEAPPTLGNYPNTMVVVAANTTVTPDASPTGATSINVATGSKFKGTFAANTTTGVVHVTNAHPAGTYMVTVKAFNVGGMTSTTFTLTVVSGTVCNGTVQFTNLTDVSVGNSPRSVAIGDFNNDGNQDVATANNLLAGTVSIRLGNGLGFFSGTTNVSVGSRPQGVAIGDFNNDGNQDFATADRNSSTVSIRLGDGLGGFSGTTTVNVGLDPISVAIGDFNNDGRQDIAAANVNSNTVSIRLGDGSGNFSGTTTVSVGDSPRILAIGDFNNDGNQDFASANFFSSTVSIRLGDGLGGFSGTTDVSVGTGPISVAVGDFNNDGNQDFASANQSANTVSIRLGDGLGGFSGTTDVSSGTSPTGVGIGDFNNDGNQDVAAANDTAVGTVSVRLGDGLGNFSDTTNVSVGNFPASTAIGDFNNDGHQDLASANGGSNTVSIRLGGCVGTSTPTPSPTPTATPTAAPTPTPTPSGTPTPTPTPLPTVNISGTVLYCSNPVPGPVPNVTLTLTGSASGSTLSDGSGNYMFSSLAPGGNYTVTPTKAPRVPGSTSINTVDVIAVQRHFLNFGTPLSGCRLTAADVNGVGGVNTVDVIAVQRFFLGLSTGIANTGKYQFSPVSRNYPGIVTSQTGQNYDTLIFGDVAAGFVELAEGLSQTAADNGTSAREVPATVAVVALPEVALEPSRSNFIAAVGTSTIDVKNMLVGFQGDFTFDERVVTFQSEPAQKAGITGGNWNVSGNVLPGTGPIRTLRVSAYSNDFTALSGSGTLFELSMTRVTPSASTELIWAAPPDHFIFIDADLNPRKPGNAAPGSVTSSTKRN